MRTTANIICTGALGLLGVIDPEDTPSAPMLADAFRRLNMMLGSWSLQSLTIPVIAREDFPIVAGKGGTNNPYTIGPGGDFDTTRPADLEGVGLVLAPIGSAPPVEITRALLTDEMYQLLAIKDLTNSLFTNAYYNATFAGGLGQLFLWPVPDQTINRIAIYRAQQLERFTSPTAAYDFPEGADEAVEYNLAKRLLDVYTVDAQRKMNVIDIARSSLGVYKRSNTKIADIPCDPMFTPNDAKGGYNINTGIGGGTS
jgi:hypothetical protein